MLIISQLKVRSDNLLDEVVPVALADCNIFLDDIIHPKHALNKFCSSTSSSTSLAVLADFEAAGQTTNDGDSGVPKLLCIGRNNDCHKYFFAKFPVAPTNTISRPASRLGHYARAR